MTYQNTATPSIFAMAAQNTLGHVVGFFVGIGRAMMTGSAAYRRMEVARILQSKTDAELGALGIRRDEIVHHVFKDLY